MGTTNFSQAIYTNVKDSKASAVSLPNFSVTSPADVVRDAIARDMTGASVTVVSTRCTRGHGTSRERRPSSDLQDGKRDLTRTKTLAYLDATLTRLGQRGQNQILKSQLKAVADCLLPSSLRISR